jgi:ribosomal protein S18 acetylase RimI-like enzyme
MASITVRQAKIHDVEQVAELFNDYRQFYDQATDIELAKQFIKARLTHADSVILVAENQAQQIVGFCQLYPAFCSILALPIYILYDLFVAPSLRKTGAGRSLMIAAQAHAKSNGYARLDLTTAKNNYVAQALYASLGWERDDVFYAYTKSV